MGCSENWGYGRYGCEVVQGGFKIKMANSKADPRACHKPPKFCQDYFSLTTRGIWLNSFDMINIDIKLLQERMKFENPGLKAP